MGRKSSKSSPTAAGHSIRRPTSIPATAAWQDLADNGSPVGQAIVQPGLPVPTAAPVGEGCPKGTSTLSMTTADDVLFEALLSGAHVENAAVVARISPRTVYRRLGDPLFRQRVDAARAAIREAIIGRLAEAAGEAVDVLWELARDECPEMRLRAAKALLDAMARFTPSATTTTTVRRSIEERRTG